VGRTGQALTPARRRRYGVMPIACDRHVQAVAPCGAISTNTVTVLAVAPAPWLRRQVWNSGAVVVCVVGVITAVS
jgi:hypothetical protein